MEVEAYRRLAPESYYEKFVAHQIRPDGRRLKDVRKTKIDVGVLPGTAGSALVVIGNTKVIAGITLQIGQPADSTPKSGDLVISFTMGPLCSPSITDNKQPDEAAALEHQILQTLLRSKCVDCDALCLAEGRAAWRLHLDLLCLNREGNVGDAALLAAVAALRACRLPAARPPPEEGGGGGGDPTAAAGGEFALLPDEEPTCLPLGPLPFPLTVGLFKDTVIPDPSLLEESLFDSQVTVVTNEEGMLCGVRKAGGGGAPAGGEALGEAIALAAQRARALAALLQNALARRGP